MNQYNSIDVGKRIAKVRTEKGFTQKVLAEEARLNYKSISAIERGHRDIRTTSLLNICNALDVTTDYLLTGRISHESSINLKSDNINARIASLSLDQYSILENIIDLYLTSTELNCKSNGSS